MAAVSDVGDACTALTKRSTFRASCSPPYGHRCADRRLPGRVRPNRSGSGSINGAPGLGGKALQTMIDEFQALNSGINIEGKNTAPTPDGQMKMIVTEQAAGDPPDIAQLGLNSVDYAVRELGAQLIDQFAVKDEYVELMKHLLPSARPLGMRNGHLYASPFTFSTPTLFYNADIFRAAPLDPTLRQPPGTTFIDTGCKLRARPTRRRSISRRLAARATGSPNRWSAAMVAACSRPTDGPHCSASRRRLKHSRGSRAWSPTRLIRR
jgi:hypothetical protein